MALESHGEAFNSHPPRQGTRVRTRQHTSNSRQALFQGMDVQAPGATGLMRANDPYILTLWLGGICFIRVGSRERGLFSKESFERRKTRVSQFKDDHSLQHLYSIARRVRHRLAWPLAAAWPENVSPLAATSPELIMAKL